MELLDRDVAQDPSRLCNRLSPAARQERGEIDLLFPGKYTYTLRKKEEIAAQALEDLDPTFAKHVQPGDVIFGGRNFGCGSSREQAASCLKYSCVSALAVESFARIFYRNAFNMGLPILDCPEAVDGIEDGDEIEINLSKGIIRNLKKGKEFRAKPIPPFMQELISAGDLVEWTKRRLKAS